MSAIHPEHLRAPQPLVLPRWTLYVVYGLHALFGLLIVASGSIGAIEVGAREYGLAVSSAALLCLIASAWFQKLPILECVFGGLLFALMSTYIVSALAPIFTGDVDAGRRAVIVLLASVIPILRSVSLGNGIIRRWALRG
jgi:hypothetical protein